MGRAAPPAWEGDPTSPRCQGGVRPGPLLGKAGASQGLGRQARPSEFWPPRRPATLRITCPKSWHKSLARAGSAWWTQPGSLLQGPGEQRLVKEEAPAGLCGARGEGRRGSRELDVREAANPGPGLPREASFPFPLGEGSKRPPPGPSTEPPRKRQLRPLAPVAHASGKGSCIPCGVWAPLLSKLRGGRPGSGAWRGVKGNRPLAPFSARSLSLVRSSHRDRHGTVHTLAHAQQSHTCTPPPTQT